MIRHWLAVAALAAGCLGCSSTPASTQQSRAPESITAISSLSADEIVRQLQDEGLDVVRPFEATDTVCPQAGCTQAVVTDRFRILTFPTTGQAQLYAAPRSMRQVATIAVGFAPVVPDDERDRYWSAIVGLTR